MKAADDLKKFRVIDLGWSQLKLAQQMGISQSVISGVENGLVKPTDKFKEKLDKVKTQHKDKK